MTKHKVWYFAVLLATAVLGLIFYRVNHAPSKHTKVFLIQIASDACICSPYSDKTISLRLLSKGEMTINSEPVAQAQLASRLRAIYETRAERTIYLSADDAITFQYLINTIAAIQAIEEGNGEFSLPKELRGSSVSMNIQIKLLTPGAIDRPCPKNCFNWAKNGVPIDP